jgi:subtilisin family serine protease
MLNPMQAIANFRASNWLAAALFCVLMTGFPLTAAAGPPDEMQLEGKQYVRMDEKWYVESTPGRWFEVVPEVVTVKFKETKTKGAMADFFGVRGADVVRANRLGAIDVRVPDGLDPVKFVAELQETGLFKYAEVNTYGRWEYIPDDTQFGDQWGLDNTGQTGGTVDADVDAPEAWDIGVALPSVAVAVLDSGVDYDHEDLECNIWVNPGEDIGGDGIVMDPADLNGVDDDGNGFIDDLIGWDFAGPDNDPEPTYDHGTHVAGIIGACGNNATGVIGVAGGTGPGTGAKMIPLLVGNDAPDGSVLDDAIIYAADNGARVIAMSLSVGYSEAIEDALTYAYDTQGLLVVNSSGNDDAAVTFPGIDPHVIAVGATDDDDIRAESPPLTWGSNFGPELEVVAPGVSIMSTVFADAYGLKSGTSMASPHVSGPAALMFSVNPAATNQEVRDCITATAEDEVGDPTEDTPGRDDYYGWGRLNTADALVCIAPNTPPVCDANGPYTAECGMGTQLDGTGSYDPDGDPLTYTWEGPFDSSPESGAMPTVIFPAPTGLKSVDLTVTDAIGDSDSCSAPVTVQDTLDPSITAPDDVLDECTSPAGTPADLGTPVTDDACDEALMVTNDAPPLFPLGATPVLWTATDDSGNSASDSQTVTIVDTTPPDLTAPPDIVAECTSPDGTPVDLGEPTVSDICDASVDVDNDAPPLFPVGTTPVLWSAIDDSGNQSFDGQDVTVEDTIPPTIHCNAPPTITPADAPISFTASAEDICDAAPVAEIVAYDCYALTKKGKRIDKTDSCVVTFDGTTLTIWDSGGVGDHIEWLVEAADMYGNESSETCEVLVVNPAQ